MKTFLKKNYIYILICISLISSLRSFFLPPVDDQETYIEIANNIINKGEYSLNGQPSTITPIIPFLVSLFYIKAAPLIGFALVKLTNLVLMIVGLKFSYRFFKKINVPSNISLIIILLSATNNNFVVWSALIYPEAILFCFTWVFLYYIIDEIKSPIHLFYFFVPFLILLITRYSYAVLGAIVAYVFIKKLYDFYLQKEFMTIGKVILISVLLMIPMFIWFKYVLNIESEISVHQSYFNRFKDHDILYNIKAGIGLIQHENVNRINGIPAFISLFLPITGVRNWTVSIILLLIFIIGYITKWKSREYRVLFFYIFLVMAGFVLAGTGFSRYWLPLLPGYLLGFYLVFKKFISNDNYFVRLSLVLSIIYIINELRIDFLILSKL